MAVFSHYSFKKVNYFVLQQAQRYNAA